MVFEFYSKATIDILIGHHFRKIQTHQGSHPLKPPMEAFQDHLPRIELFWEVQLLEDQAPKVEKPFDLLNIHRQMKLNPGELDRWVMLFIQTLEAQANEENENFINQWKEKIELFKGRFKKDSAMFSHIR